MTIISFIGLPCSGKGTLIAKLHDKLLDTKRTAILSMSNIVKLIATDEDREVMAKGELFPKEPELRQELYSQIEGLFALGAEIVLLDGFPRFDDQVKWLVQTLFDHKLSIIDVKVKDDFELMKRASIRNRNELDNGDKFKARLNLERIKLSSAERQILSYSLPYTTIINVNIDQAVEECLMRLKQQNVM